MAYAVSAVAHWDWPDAWPQLFGLLMDLLTGGDVDGVHGAMRVLTGNNPLIFFCNLGLNIALLITCFRLLNQT